MKYLIKNEKDLEKLAENVLILATEKKYNHATVLALQGELGAGKTTFTKSLARILGITDSVTSPTFVIQKTFSINSANSENDDKNLVTENKALAKAFSNNSFAQLIHIDSYRLDLSAELAHLGWHDLLNQKENLIVVEWPERIADILPMQYILLKFTHVDETTREVEVVVVDDKK
jgi:tRNA threonylcarbamoyladenosine biosynthesis protein TsaE